jgi:hypothetical protein
MMAKRSRNIYAFITYNDTYVYKYCDWWYIHLYILVYIFHDGMHQPNCIKTQFVPYLTTNIIFLFYIR